MITLVRLSNWRAYTDFEMHVEAGTTLVIAMNGVGKSSLLEAVQWALTRNPKHDSERIRKGERDAEVEVRLVAGSTPMRIVRHLTLGAGKKPLRTPKTTVTSWISDSNVSEDAFFDRLAEEWGAHNDFVSRIAFLDDRLIQQNDEPNLRAHLCQAFGLDQLESQVLRLEPEIVNALKQANEAQTTIREATRDLDEAEKQVTTHTVALQASREEEEVLREQLQEATASLQIATIAASERARQVQWDLDAATIIADSHPHAGPIAQNEDLRVALRAARHAAERQAQETQTERARLSERIEFLETALQALEGAESECPVCRRPLDGESKVHAREVHDHDRTLAEAQLAHVDVESPAALVTTLGNLLHRAESLGDRPSDVPGEDTDIETAQQHASECRAALDSVLIALGGLQKQVADSIETRDRLVSQADDSDLAETRFRYHAHLCIAKSALESTVSDVLAAQVGPVGIEVSNRWSGVFKDRPGLVVDIDGKISRQLNEELLPYTSFSNGEKTVARLLFRLATLTTTTNVPFCWIDEPLEHLDNHSKVLVARTLAMYARDGLVKQIIVTTFQEELAITLQTNKSEKVRVEYIGTEQVQV